MMRSAKSRQPRWTLPLLATAIAALVAGCAAYPGGGPPSERSVRGQGDLQGMENSVLHDENPNNPVQAKPPY